MPAPTVVFGTPRKLPSATRLTGRVVVLDIAFAGAQAGGYEKITLKFLTALGPRLACWVDHHDHERHPDFEGNPRFLLRTKAEHGACPELVTPELVERVGPVDTILCHSDFDGIASAAKWLRGGREPYPGADDDARAIDTRIGTPSDPARQMDRALRAQGHNEVVLHAVLNLLTSGLQDPKAQGRVDEAAEELRPIELETERAARSYRVYPSRHAGDVAYVNVAEGFARLDKTELLLAGQRRAKVAVVIDSQNVSVAAAFDSGLNFLTLFGLQGGMPTRVSLARSEEDLVLSRLGVDFVP